MFLGNPLGPPAKSIPEKPPPPVFRKSRRQPGAATFKEALKYAYIDGGLTSSIYENRKAGSNAVPPVLEVLTNQSERMMFHAPNPI
ncbi:MAG: hypothetical protein N2645_01030 [Clostridia bacterium]|nr:hypothetical protein [Clostridia bacterium]